MDLKKLEQLFYDENAHLVEVLDKGADGKWAEYKTRGYGIAICEYKGLTFGIPLRSHIKHDYSYKTADDKGLDFMKAVLLSKASYISTDPFKIPVAEHKKIQQKSHFILNRFENYVQKYIKAVTSGDKNKLRDFRFSTLQNYHVELGIEAKAVAVVEVKAV